jgi:hypothetical protein
MPEEYRSNLFLSSGYMAGVTSGGKLFGPGTESKSSLPKSVLEDLKLSLRVEHRENGFEFILEASKRSNQEKNSAIMFINKTVKLKKGLLGNLTLFADKAKKNHAASIPADIKEFQTDVTFKDWQISGDKVKQNQDQTQSVFESIWVPKTNSGDAFFMASSTSR